MKPNANILLNIPFFLIKRLIVHVKNTFSTLISIICKNKLR